MMVIFTTDVVPFEWQIPGWNWALIIPLSLVVGCHILVPVRLALFFFLVRRNVFILFLCFPPQIVLNPWLMIFSY